MRRTLRFGWRNGLGTYREPTKEQHIYVRNMEQIQHILFPPPRRPRPDPDISSFIGLAGSLLNWYTTDVREKIFEVFIGRLFDHKAMSPIDYDKIDDESIKRSIIRGLHVQLALPTMLRYEQLVNSSSAAYYAAWKHK